MKKITLEQFIEKARKVHGDLYDYSKVVYINAHTKICIIDPVHGEFWMIANSHLSGQGNPKRGHISRCKKLTKTTEQFILEANIIHNDCQYTKTIYRGKKIPIIVIDKSYGEYSITPESHLSGKGHPKRTSNNISKISLTWLLSIDPIQKFITPYYEPSLLINGNKRKVDGYDPQTNTVYQFHGSYWHGLSKDGKKIMNQLRYNNTLLKDQEIRDSGFNLVVVWEHDWKPTQEDWKRLLPIKSNVEQFIEKARKVHGDLYDYSKAVYFNSMTKFCIIDPIYGEFWQTPAAHISGAGNLERSRQLRNLLLTKTTEQFISESINIYGDRFDYIETIYIGTKIKTIFFDKIKNKKIYQSPDVHLSNGKKRLARLVKKHSIKDYLSTNLEVE